MVQSSEGLLIRGFNHPRFVNPRVQSSEGSLIRGFSNLIPTVMWSDGWWRSSVTLTLMHRINEPSINEPLDYRDTMVFILLVDVHHLELSSASLR